MKVLPGLITLFAVLTASLGYAQWGGWRGGYHASTAGEGYQRGFADIVRSAGMRNMMNSEAAKNMQDARSKDIQNNLDATKAYFEIKRHRKEYHDSMQKPRPSSEQLFRLAKTGTPGELSHSDLDPVSGGVQWPGILQEEEFKAPREALEALLADRASTGGQFDLEQYRKIAANVEEMQETLKSMINDIPPQVFSQANAFLKKMDYTASRPG